MENVYLPYTLQTWVGMVLNNGLPQTRRLPPAETSLPVAIVTPNLRFARISSFADFTVYEPPPAIVNTAIECLSQACSLSPAYTDNHNPDLACYAANIDACRFGLSKDDLKIYIRKRARLDLEQAAAAVVSSFLQDGRISGGLRLAAQLGAILATSSMWIERDDYGTDRPVPLENCARLLQKFCSASGAEVPLATSYSKLLPILVRIRRAAPRNRCLHIPEWIFTEASDVTIPEHFREFYKAQSELGERGELAQGRKGSVYPTHLAGNDTIVLSRNHFRALQRRIFRLYKFWKPEIRLRRKIKDLESEVLYASSWIEERVFGTEDVALVAYYFFLFQRRLQRKVVSGYGWTTFLGKGEGATLFQNNLSIKSGFEQVLAEIAGLNTISDGGGRNIMENVKQTCLLMKEYVDVYGQGQRENLVFKSGVSGGKGRGPVDEYNLLCDILHQLKENAKDQGLNEVLGPVHKFLAKDIMHWNNAWGDDAFANGKIPGWEVWLRERSLL